MRKSVTLPHNVCRSQSCALSQTACVSWQNIIQASFQVFFGLKPHDLADGSSLTQEQQCRCAHHAKVVRDFLVQRVCENIEPCEFYLALVFLGDLIDYGCESVTPRALFVPKIDRRQDCRFCDLLLSVFRADFITFHHESHSDHLSKSI